MRKNDTMRGIMKPKQKKKPSRQRLLDIHYRSNGDEYEYVARLAHEQDRTVAEYTRRKLIPALYEPKLEELRAKQRKRGDLDEWFIHPKLKKAS